MSKASPTGGAAFDIFLPRHLGQDTPATALTSAQSASMQGHETILLVEDEPSLLRIGKRALQGLGYNVLAAASPSEAIRLAEQHPGTIHLLMTDVIMPEMNGRDLASHLLARHPGLKRLFMSGYTADVIAHHGVLEEGIHFLQKPFTIPVLAEHVRHALGDGLREALPLRVNTRLVVGPPVLAMGGGAILRPVSSGPSS